jgi:hypothetical protein
MPNRNTSHEQNKLDHSTHPTTRSTKDDLRAPGGGGAERPDGRKPTGNSGQRRDRKSSER